MGSSVKKKRPYDSRRRKEQARQTREAILDAAGTMFRERGYARTTVAAVAEAAHVSVETVYKAFGDKAHLLKGVFDVAIVGDHAPVPMPQRDLVRRIEAEPDPRRKFEIYGEHLAQAGPRAGPVQLLVRAAGGGDPEVAAVWDQMSSERLRGMTEFARHLYDGGYLHAGVTLEEARDVLWTYNSVELYDLLVVQRGWPPGRYGAWVARALASALLA
jgi:AcrR family transcriptional regulator